MQRGVIWLGQVVVLCMALALVLVGSANAMERFNAKGIASPIYLQGDMKPAAVLRVESLHTEYARKGFFRIGLLPLVVAEQVSIEVRDEARLPEILRQSSAALRRLGREQALEVRGLSLRFAEDTQAVLVAGGCQFSSKEQWLLTDGVQITDPDGTCRADRASLQWTAANGLFLSIESEQSERQVHLRPLHGRSLSEGTSQRDQGSPARSQRSIPSPQTSIGGPFSVGALNASHHP